MTEIPTIYDVQTDSQRPITQQDVDILMGRLAVFEMFHQAIMFSLNEIETNLKHVHTHITRD